VYPTPAPKPNALEGATRMDVKRWARIGLVVLLGWGATGFIDPDVGLASPSPAITSDENPSGGSTVLLAKKKKKKQKQPSAASPAPQPSAVSSNIGQQRPGTDTPTPVRSPRAPTVGSPGDPFLALLYSGFNRPIFVTHAGDGSDRLFVVEQGGLIKVIKNGQILSTPYLDLTGIVSALPPPPGISEQGLLSLAFHPDFVSNGIFFVYYTDKNMGPNNVGANTLARYTVSNPAADVANVTNTPLPLIVQPDNFGNHNGGTIMFDRNPTPGNRLLYLSIGDEGSSGDPNENAQDLTSIFGKILRIDVNGSPDSGLSYKIPTSNPFYSSPSGARKEIWAWGLRNPWRTSFDRVTGDLYIGDVGQNLWEEVDFQSASSAGGENYGWDEFEGTHCFEPTFPNVDCVPAGKVLPVLEYPHGSQGCSVTGGYVYRGALYSSLVGSYFYSDYCSGIVSKTQKPAPASGPWSTSALVNSGENVVSFGEDEDGEVYVVAHGGKIYRIADPGCAPRPNVQVSVVPGPLNSLIATVRAGTNVSTPDNGLFSVQFTELSNAIVDINGSNNHSTPFTAALDNGIQASFTVRRPQPPAPGLATTAHFVVTDACGAWPSFVGGGPGAF
jgi:glucose/arabinose dehydrogenase